VSSAMRMVYLAVIFLLSAAAIIFAVQYHTSVGVSFHDFCVTMPLAALVALIYVQGAATGGSRFAPFRRSHEGSWNSARS